MMNLLTDLLLSRHGPSGGLIALVMLALAGVMAYGAAKLKPGSDMEVFFSADDPYLEAYDLVRDTYARDDNVFLVLTPDTGQVFTRENLHALEELTQAAWTLPHSIRVDSMANFQHSEAHGDELSSAPLISEAQTLSEQDIARIRQIAIAEPTLIDRFVTPDGRMAAVNISISLPPGDRFAHVQRIHQAAWQLRRDFEQRYPELRVLVTGKVIGNYEFTQASTYDFTHVVPLALATALLCIGLYMFLASGSLAMALSSTFATIVVIAASVTVGMGFAGYTGMEVTPLLANVPTIILTLAVADCMHLYVTYFSARRDGESKEDAIAHTLRVNFRAVFLTSLTTVIGFMALNFSESPPFHELGNTVAVGIVAAWAYSIFLLPTLMRWSTGQVHARDNSRQRGMARLAAWVIAHRRACLWSCVCAIAISASFLPRNGLYDVWAEYFDESVRFRQESDLVRAHLSGFDSIEFSLGSGESGGVADPAYLRLLDEYANWLRQQPEVAHVTTFADVMKRLNRSMHGDDPRWYRLPDERELAAQYLLLYEFSLPFGLDLTNMVDLDKSSTRMIVGLSSSSTQRLIDLQARAIAWQQERAPPSFHHKGASIDTMFAHIGKRNVIQMWLGSMAGLLAISLIIALALKSWRFGLLSLALNFLPIIVGFGIWGLLVGRVGLGLSIVSGLTMGIVVDFTVHLLSKYQMAQQQRQLNTPDAIRYAFSTVGVALVVTTLVLVVNFGLLALSVFSMNSELGILTAWIIVIALLIDLFLLPPLLLLMEKTETATSGLPRPASATPG